MLFGGRVNRAGPKEEELFPKAELECLGELFCPPLRARLEALSTNETPGLQEFSAVTFSP